MFWADTQTSIHFQIGEVFNDAIKKLLFECWLYRFSEMGT